MQPSSDEATRHLKRLTDGLKHAGVKLTHQRLEVCREVAGATNHPDAETVFHGVRARVPTISLDTVYRTLALLADRGLITRIGALQERMRFDANRTPHHHFVCARCGEMYDFTCETFDRLPIPADAHAFGHVQTVQVEIRGICRRCQPDRSPDQPGHQRKETP
ncbi:MAG TPA: Fur family transcriptional regulator [Armatimonadota bacterium]|nr:Fur family transcriptional regulator [Armatimonadota bacterium]